ncbi:unnamed protein product, partial [Cochlearia groenlandica]
MDCNKEEAVKAKKLAEEKIQAGDYVGAHRFVTKAQRLFPNLDNIPQMIAICDVHSNANKKINELDNWYGILQVQPFSDVDAIRKRYRKLALLLHSDKNKFVGAEAAFKLVGEANRWLSDPIKRSQYDHRYRSQSVLAAKLSIANSVRHGGAAENPLGKISIRGEPNQKNQDNKKKVDGKRKPKKDEVCIENEAEGGNPQKGMNISAEIHEADVLKPQPEVKETSTRTEKLRPGLTALKKNQASKKKTKAVEESSKKFNVFEVRPKPENFAVNQVWSVSDSTDGMPRKYVQVKEVLNTVFKMLITHLEPVHDMNDENIPFACGKFESGKIEEVEDRSIFSGQMHHLFLEKHSSDSQYLLHPNRRTHKHIFIYPRKGEIWAIFRDWNEEWNTSLEKHKLPYKYDFVEVLSDFSNEVAYLGKVKGFASRFHWEAQQQVCQIQFNPQEILRFSHKVPAVKVTEKEKECSVPGDSYELDRAALPKDILQVHMETEKVILKGEADGSCPEAPQVEVKSTPVPKFVMSPWKHQKPDIASCIG